MECLIMPIWVGIGKTDRWRGCWGQVCPWRGAGCEVRAIGSSLTLKFHITISLHQGLPNNTYPPSEGLRMATLLHWSWDCPGTDSGPTNTSVCLTCLICSWRRDQTTFSLHHRHPSPHGTHLSQWMCFLNFHRMTHAPGKESQFYEWETTSNQNN